MQHRTTLLGGLVATLALVVSLNPPAVGADQPDPLGPESLGAATAMSASAKAGTDPVFEALVRNARAVERKQALARQARKARRTARAQARLNPLAGRPWGVYKGAGDQAWAPYTRSSGENRRLLAKIALRPKAKWFGAWIGDDEIEGNVRDYIANAAGGDQDTLVQMSVFRMVPWEHEACGRLPSGAEQAGYRRWIDGFAAGVGAQHTAIILQPDGPFAQCVPGGSSIPTDLIAYSAKKFSALPHTSVYIDGGAADWPPEGASGAVDFLVKDGVKYARGIALDSTHYTATGDDIDRGTEIIEELARRGVPGKHLVINTSSNGKPFAFNQARGSDPDNAGVCSSSSDSGCVTLGIPPTTDVANARWGLSAAQRGRARAHVDGYLWFGRPWLYRQADPFDLARALQLVRTTPY